MKRSTAKNSINKKAAAAMMALMLTTGTLAAPLGESGPFSVVPMNITVADAATTTTYDLNTTATYKALTKAKVTSLWKSYTADTVGTYRDGYSGTYYKSGKAPSTSGSWYEGELTADTLKAIQNNINIYRELAGLSPITAKSTATYQKGALVRSTPGNFAHDFTSKNVKPSGMSSSLWNTGAACKNWILAGGASPSGLAYTWVSERNNLAGDQNTGHRMTIMNPTYTTMYFGYSNGVGLGYADAGSGKIKEAASTFPSAGYYPVELVDWYSPAPWMVQLNSSKLKISNINSVKVTIKGGGKTYTRTLSNGGLSRGSYGSFYGGDYIVFTAPSFTKGKALTGDYAVSVTGLTDASGKAATLNYTIKFYSAANDAATDISKCTATLSATKYTYDGKAKTPTVTVKNGTKTLTKGTDYTVAYKNNTNAGTATVTITGKGSYKGTITKTFTIEKDTRIDITKFKATVDQPVMYYDGTPKLPNVTVMDGSKKLVSGKDFVLGYDSYTNVGTGKVSVNGIGKYKGQIKLTYTIAEPIQVNIPDLNSGLKLYYAYTGKAVTPKPVITYKGETLTEGKDYEITKYSNNVNVGKAYAHVKFKGKYKGAVKMGFTITDKTVVLAADCKITKPKTITYNGSPVTPKLTLTFKGTTLVEGRDYTLTFSNNNARGTGKASFILKGDYAGSIYLNFTIS